MPDLRSHPLHLGLGATTEVLPAFTGDMAWYDAYSATHRADGAEGRLVTLFDFDSDWDSWEMHPEGSEAVVCLSGTMTLHQDYPDGRTATVTLAAGGYAINDAGVWHTADIAGKATALFITAGQGTQTRPR